MTRRTLWVSLVIPLYLQVWAFTRERLLRLTLFGCCRCQHEFSFVVSR